MGKPEEKGERGPVVALVAGLLCLTGLYGAVGGWPFAPLARQASTLADIVTTEFGLAKPLLYPRVYDGEGVVAADPARMAPGHTLVTGAFADGHAIRLLDDAGRVVHEWEVDFYKHFPDARDFVPKKRFPAAHENYHLQGVEAFPDGSLLFNYSHFAAVKLDACSNVEWRVKAPLHHQITANPDGTFWVPSHRELADTPEEWITFPYDRASLEAITKDAKRYHDTVVLLSPEGEILHEVSILEAVVEDGPEQAFYEAARYDPTDLTHLNDVEVVTPALAARIEGVEAGDLLVSLRDFHMLAIIDPDSNALKWYRSGPWVRQHDPDIAPDGTITLFNNRSGFRGQSQLLRYDPASDAVELLYPHDPDTPFFSDIMGTQQALPNGNVLLTESTGGRIIEITPAGEVVWDYRAAFDEEDAALLTEAVRLAPDFFEPGALACAPSRRG